MSDIEKLLAKAIEAKLDGLSALVPFSKDKIAEIYNGIGPDSFPEWLRDIITSLNGLFEPAAMIHDVDYYIGGDHDKFTADNDRFKQNCYKLAKLKFGWYNPLRYIAMNKGRRWGNYCQIGGWKNYNQKEESESEPETETSDPAPQSNSSQQSQQSNKSKKSKKSKKYLGIFAMSLYITVLSGCAAVKNTDFSEWCSFHNSIFKKLSSAFSKSESETEIKITENSEK